MKSEYPSIYISSSVLFVNIELHTKNEKIKPTLNSLNRTIPRLNHIFCLTYSFVWHFNDWEKKETSFSCRESLIYRKQAVKIQYNHL